MTRKFALVIGNTEYTDSGLAQLAAPGRDAEDFARVLKDPEISAFDHVDILVNQPSSSVIEAIDGFFDQKKPDDLLVLYFSGHGVKDEMGSLYLAFKNTVRTRLRSTAIKSEYIREAMDQSRSKRQVVILDCCNSGAFPAGTKAETGGVMGMTQAFQGYGRFVLTASDATQFAWEGDKVIGETKNSLFTHFLVKGLQGEADLDGDGKITVDELYDYSFEQISMVTPNQTPTKSSSKVEGEIVLRQFTRIEDIKPMPLPDDVTSEMDDLRPYVREEAVKKLSKILKGKNIGMARSAVEALEKIVADENTTRRVAQAAQQALDDFHELERKAEEERQSLIRVDEERLQREKAEAERKAREDEEREAESLKAKNEAAKLKLATLQAEAEKEAARKKADREAAERAAAEKAKRDDTEKIARPSNKKEKSAGPSYLKWIVAGVIGLCALGGGIWGFSYLSSLTAAARGVPTDSYAMPTTTSRPVFTSEPDCFQADIFCVGLVTDVGTINDQSFNQSAWEGVQLSQTDRIVDWARFIENSDSKDYSKNIDVFAESGYDVIVTVGFGMSEATAMAAQSYPNVKFIGVDQDQSTEISNLVGLNFPEDQAGFSVGALAAMMSKSHLIGAVCGTDVIPAVWRFGEGYKAGAAYADTVHGTSTGVFVVYHSDVGFDKTFVDPEWGAQTAASMMDQGADVIFGCGGVTGNGAITAAAQAGAYAIGVDTDQYFTLPEASPRMLSSAIKNINAGIYELIGMAKADNFPTGNFYGTGGYAPFHDLESEVPADVKMELERITAGLLDGSISTNVAPAKP